MSRVRIFVGTRRGLFHFTSDSTRETWTVSPPLLKGREVYFIGRDAGSGFMWATTDHKVWGPHIHTSHDLGESWDVLTTAPHYDDERALRAVWSIAAGAAPNVWFAGIEPAGLFMSLDLGGSWQGVQSLNAHATATTWQPAGGALAMHSVHVHERRIICAVSAGGFYRSDDEGISWRALNRGVRAEFLPRRFPAAGHCVHRLVAHPLQPDRLYQQNHCGTYRSDNGGEEWIEITNDLPSDYGYALAVDPQDPDVAYVIPEESSEMRTTVGGRLRVYRTTDAGRSWQPLRRGLPQENAWISILREGMATDPLNGVYFGTSGGHLFGSRDRGESWRVIAAFLPRVICVHVVVTE